MGSGGGLTRDVFEHRLGAIWEAGATGAATLDEIEHRIGDRSSLTTAG